MSKRPFNKIRKIQKKENIEDAEGNKEEPKIEQIIQRQNTNKPPKLSVEKKRIRIGNGQPTKNNQDNVQPQQKNTLGSKPNLFKGKRQGGKLIINSNRNTNNVEPLPQQSYSEAPKPTPLVIKKRFNLQANKERENIVIQEEDSYQKLNADQSQNFNVDESTTMKRKPDLKIKRFLQKRQPSQKNNQFEQSNNFNSSTNNQPKQQPFIPLPIQYRQINIQPNIAAISQGKLDKQRKRTNQLKNLLNLQMDLYEQTLTIGSVTPYEIYINKIKGAFLKNSNDQAFDDKTSNSCQTSTFEYTDFTNQCPQDYSIDISRIQNIDSSAIFDKFILKVAPVIEELMKPTDMVTQPPIFLLAFRPTFKSFMKCPYPIFIYRSEEFNLDLIVVGEKLYITQGEISSVLMIGKNIIGGLKNGYLVFWNGQNNKASRLYQQIRQFTQTTNFQLPSYATHQLQRYSSYSSQFSIVSLLRLEKSEFISMDSSGKIVRWGIEEGTNNIQQIRPLSVIELKSLTQHWALQAFQIKSRGDNLYINTSLGIICLHNQQIRQRLDIQGIKVTTFEIPKKSSLLYAVNQNNTLLIYNQLYSHHLFEMSLQVGTETIRQIIIPQIEHQNRELLYLFVIYLIDTAGKIYELRLLQNKFEYVKQLGEQQQSQGRRDKSLIFRGVSRIGQSLQTVRLMRDLKINTSFSKMNIVASKTIPNLKSILEKNRELMSMLQQQQSIMI